MDNYQDLLRLMGRVIARAEPLGEQEVVDEMLRLKTSLCRRLASQRSCRGAGRERARRPRRRLRLCK